MKRIVGTAIGIGLLLLLGCATRAPAEATLATTVEDVVGVWHGSAVDQEIYIKFKGDGTLFVARGVDWLEEHPDAQGEFWFEGTQFYWKDIKAPDWTSPRYSDCLVSNHTAIYEAQLLPNGNLKFVTIRDRCAFRAMFVPQTEWEPVR